MCVARWIVVYGAPAYITSSKEWTISAPSMLNLTAPRFSLSAASIDTFINPTVSSRSGVALPLSFGYLKNLQVDYLKIDGMFVKDIVDDPIDRAMVKSINDTGHVMGMETIAEFVENDDIKDMLSEIGVDFAQGYGIGRSRPFDELPGI